MRNMSGELFLVFTGIKTVYKLSWAENSQLVMILLTPTSLVCKQVLSMNEIQF